MSEPTRSDYALKTEATLTVAAPDLPYRPPRPQHYRPKIGLVGCGGISPFHLQAYREMGLEVAALCDRNLEKARARQREFFPEAWVSDDPYRLIRREDLEVLDLTPHPEDRLPLIRAAIEAGKHVLSQKPFVLDLDEGERLCELAQQRGVKLAVNQNGRWAPHFAYLREAVRGGVIGEVLSVHCGVHWDHTWTAGTPFEEIEDLVLLDFGIHWFDFLASLVGPRAVRVQASRSFAAGQSMKPPMLAQVIVELEGGQASLVFDAHLKYGPQDHTYVGGSQGSLISLGPDLGHQRVELHTRAGKAVPALEGHWFQEGFQGTMGELLCALEERREPLNNARDNLQSLALCFAAIRSAREGTAKRPGEVRRYGH
ncbi:MAG: gfo/Idh/MocA family oxidoreductase [Meiothermus sp.]